MSDAKLKGYSPAEVGARPDDLTHRAESDMRLLVLVFRLLGWFWMLLLVIATLAIDDQADRSITIGAMVVATVWTGVTLWAWRHRSRLGSSWFVIADGVVALFVAWASYVAHAGDLFHGGYPISWMAVAAYGGGLRWAIPASLIIGLQQSVLLLQNGRTAVAAVGSIVFVGYAVIIGWLFGMIRASDLARRKIAAELTREREEHARRLERLELANRLHDSALQTLQMIGANADDPIRVRMLARRQTRELRDLVDTYASTEAVSLETALVRVASDIEDLFDVEVSSVIRADVDMDRTLGALVEAAREAMTNSAKYSGAQRIDLYAAFEDGSVAIYIRDEGRGFDSEQVRQGHGLEYSVRGRVREVGGEVCIESTPGEGTEVKVSAMPQRVLS
jgi:signal transduction histidine kinase